MSALTVSDRPARSRLTGTTVYTADVPAPWIVAAEYEDDGFPVVDVSAMRSGRTVRRFGVPVSDLRFPSEPTG